MTDLPEIVQNGTAADVEVEIDDPNLGITRPFDPDKIKVNTIPALIDGIIKRIDFKEIDLAPAFQRKARLWDIGRKSRLIESLLLKIPLPVFYVASDGEDRWSVVDGIQRMTTIYDFVKNVFVLQDLEYLTKLNGSTFEQLPRPLQRRIEETQLIMNLIQDGTPEEVMINIFKRINTGGMELTAQEIRNALNKGVVREFLQEVAKAREFSTATTNPVNDTRMQAQEMVLRFFAFYLHPWQEYASKNDGLDKFLTQTMRELNTLSEAERGDLDKKFRQAMDCSRAIFGGDTFRKPQMDGRRKPINKALFETWSVNLAHCAPEQQADLILKKDILIDSFKHLMEDDEFNTSISSSTAASTRVEIRFSRVEQLIKETLK
ncbi:DUF262 domain-containing protein [Undibacterium sp. CY18W]|uniref:DUF262 domain-containing protein n=1 Tax=Undibacterium hunanense TaxID=2762292 RepID=A0ABR6ZYU0_9BURK|nr:DUF262 domain-containing protein [Undibacterium hunanense]MBC3921022.1 DUF262 domain-containing protein [Undibacterium hunanense]